jgi:diguanylate cyclase (GGDEF)-like protein/PAS domain S-box-containing protein
MIQSTNSQLILIIDDNHTNLEVLSETLNDAGYEVAVAVTGERAIRQIHHSPPDLILLDIMMPGIDGYETCQIIKNNSAWASIPIIFMTALADTSNKVKGFELGAVDYITKPFQEKEILARVRTHLRLKQTEMHLRQSEAQMESILNSLEEVVWSATLDLSQFTFLNPAVKKIFGCSANELIAAPHLWFDMVHPEDKVHLKQAFQLLKAQSYMSLEYRIFDTTGNIRWLKIRAQMKGCYADGETERVDGIIIDISDQKRVENQLIHEANHDNLTGLANRNSFIVQINRILDSFKHCPNENFAVLFIDLDRFKSINDSLGHYVGDQLLQQVAKRLQECMRPTDLIARLGGDEFTILLKNLSNPEESITISERIQSQLTEAFKIEDQIFFTSASIGIVIACSNYSSAEELLRDADIAMYQAKKRGKSRCQLFKPSMHIDTVRHLELERDLRLALNRQEITLQYQPIVNLQTQQTMGFEALARWKHPQKGYISPGDFIPIAEESGLIVSLGEHVLRQACQQLKQWKTRFPEVSTYTMSVNLSGKQLQSVGFIDTLDEILSTNEISGHQLTLEITESVLIDNHDSLLTLLCGLSERGITLSLDDFGTGYSSLSYLHRYPLNELKIDRSFVDRIENDIQSQEIVKTILSLANILNMIVVAEGVESFGQMEYLKTLNCNKAQGYLFSKPMTKPEIDKWLERQQTNQLISA